MIYFIGLKLGSVLNTKWIRWPILIFVGLNAVPAAAFGAFFALSAGFSFLGYRGMSDDRAWFVIIWYVLALPLYAVLFLKAAHRSQVRRPSPTLEGDTRESGTTNREVLSTLNLSSKEVELMGRWGVSYDGNSFRCGDSKFENLSDAITHAMARGPVAP
jgi:hypothetical protein